MEVTDITPTGGEYVTYNKIDVRYLTCPVFLRMLDNSGSGAFVRDHGACRAMDYYATPDPGRDLQ